MRALRWLITVLLFLGAVGIILFLLKEPSLPVFPILGQDRVTGKPDPTQLRTLSASDAIRRHLLDGDFAIAHRMQDIPADCSVVFAADPGQEFNNGDAIIKGLPYRQLHFAGVGPKSCFMYYQRGGATYSSCLAILDRATVKIVWLGVTRKNGANLDDLRSLLSRHQFDDTGGPDC